MAVFAFLPGATGWALPSAPTACQLASAATLTSSGPSPSGPGQAVNFTVSVRANTTGLPCGGNANSPGSGVVTIRVINGTHVDVTNPVLVSGQQVLHFVGATAGTYLVSVQYQGSQTNANGKTVQVAGATSNTITQTVAPGGFAANQSQGSIGTTIGFFGSGCFQSNAQINSSLGSSSVLTRGDGTWSQPLTVPSGTVPGSYTVTAACGSPPNLSTYPTSVSFTVTPPPVPVLATIDRTGQTDVTAQLNAFLASVPNGSTVDFPAGGRYRIEGTLVVSGKSGVTIDGHGSTFFATTIGPFTGTPTANGHRSQWSLQLDTNLTVKNMTVRGSSTHTGPTSPRGTGIFDANNQWQHGFEILASTNALVTNVNVGGTWGDLVYFGSLKNPVTNKLQPTSGATITNSTLVGASRQGVTVTNADHVTISNNTIDSVLYQGVDLEPDSAVNEAAFITVSGNKFGSHGAHTMSGGGAGIIHDIVFANNTTLDRGVDSNGFDLYPFQFTFQPNIDQRESNFTITNNVMGVYGTNQPFIELVYIDHVTTSGNRGSVPAKPWPVRSDKPFAPIGARGSQAPITAACNTGVTVSGNVFTPKPPGMPDAVVYPCP